MHREAFTTTARATLSIHYYCTCNIEAFTTTARATLSIHW